MVCGWVVKLRTGSGRRWRDSLVGGGSVARDRAGDGGGCGPNMATMWGRRQIQMQQSRSQDSGAPGQRVPPRESEVKRQKSKVGIWKLEVGNRESEVGSWEVEVGS